MDEFGIAGYRPRWLAGLDDIRAAHGRRLGGLVGRRLTDVWVVWDQVHDEWFADAPVVVVLDGEQLEVSHQKFDELSITWNSIDLSRPIPWPTDTFSLTWRHDARADLRALRGRTVRCVALLECTMQDLAYGMVTAGSVGPPEDVGGSLYCRTHERRGLERAGAVRRASDPGGRPGAGGGAG